MRHAGLRSPFKGLLTLTSAERYVLSAPADNNKSINQPSAIFRRSILVAPQGDKPKARWLVLMGSSLFWYGSQALEKLKGEEHLGKDTTVRVCT
jgi:hypothetical protein